MTAGVFSFGSERHPAAFVVKACSAILRVVVAAALFSSKRRRERGLRHELETRRVFFLTRWCVKAKVT